MKTRIQINRASKSIYLLLVIFILLGISACDNYFYIAGTSPAPVYESGVFTLSFDPNKSQRELVDLINNARESIYVALYGFNNEAIEEALYNAWWHRGIDLQMITEYDAEHEGSWDSLIEKGSWPHDRNFPVHLRNKGGIMHNKYFIVDEEYIVTGSTNLTEGMLHHFNNLIIIKSKELAADYLRDFRILQVGTSSSEKDDDHDLLFPGDYWPEQSYQIGAFEVQAFFTPYRRTFPSYQYEDGQDYLYYNFDKDLYEVAVYKNALNVILPLIENAQHEITIYTFAFTDRVIFDRLIKAYERGVQVKIFMDYQMFRSAFRYAGQSYISLARRLNYIKICRKPDGGLLHHKVIMIDDNYLVLGSLNFSNNAVSKNDENFIIIKNATPLIHAFEQEKARIDNYSHFLQDTDEFSGYFDEYGDDNYGNY